MWHVCNQSVGINPYDGKKGYERRIVDAVAGGGGIWIFE
jgi:hypothetical protein